MSPLICILVRSSKIMFSFSPSASSLRLSSPTITLFLKYTVITLKKKMEEKK